MLDHQSQELINPCQFWSFLKLPVHWDKETKKFVVFNRMSKDLLIWYWCMIVGTFGTLSSMFVCVSQVINADVRFSPIVIVINVLMIVLGSYVGYIGRLLLVHATHTVFFWMNFQSFKIVKQQPGTITECTFFRHH
jgi:hypothetical protein